MNLARALNFWSMVGRSHPNGCWEWKGAKFGNGYGMFSAKPSPRKAHRVAWEIANGPIPDGLLVCHRCDNRPCCNPEHLFLGTTQDNIDDKVRKGRQPKGETNAGHKLTAEQVIAIRNDQRPQHQIARDYDLHPHSIANIKQRKTWRHLP